MAAKKTAICTRLGTALAIAILGMSVLLGPDAGAQGLVSVKPLPTAPANAKPTIAGNPSRMLVAGSFYDFRPVAADRDSAKLAFAINKKPRWANFDPVTGRLYGTPSAIDVGRIKGIQISVSDGVSRTRLKAFGIKVIAGKPPVISGTPATTATEGKAYDFQPSASDPDQQSLQFAITNRPSWAKFDAATGRLSGTPPAGSAGAYAGIGISVTDGAATVGLAPFTITVSEQLNAAPKLSGTPPASVQVGQSYDFVPSATDADGDPLTFSSVNLPAWLGLDKASGRLSGKPQSGQEGTYPGIVLSVSDGRAIAFLGPFSITVTASTINKVPVPNTAPVIAGTPATSVAAGKAYAFQPTATDADGDPLTFSAINLPSWLSINPTTGLLSGTAPDGAGTYTGIAISVTDGKATVSLPPFAITVAVAPVNSPPTIGGTPASLAAVGRAYNFLPVAADADGDALTFTVTGRPAWLAFDSGTGRLSGTPSVADVGSYTNIVLRVSDGKASAALAAFSITVVAQANNQPTISGTPKSTASIGQQYQFQPSATDPDGDALAFGIANRPSWASFNTSTGRLTGIPQAANAGTYANIIISVSDGKDAATLAPFTITVQAAANTPPTISGVPPTTVTAGQAYQFQPTASDPDGQLLVFGIANKPSWAMFNPATGLLSGTPQAAQAGTYANIVISVSDGTASATLPAFTITVQAATDSPPTISGSPSTSATVGKAYSFQPTASDPDGQPLTFAITNKPSWAVFNAATGSLTGTPQAANVGSYANIVISVSDGTFTVKLPAFAITVGNQVLGSAEVSWTAPTQNEDGTPLADLAGFRIRYGTSPASLAQTVNVAGPAVTSASIEGLAAGTWYFAVAAYNSAGVESVLTEPVYKIIQ